METEIEIWKVRGIEGVCFADKLSAEVAAREEFPSEHGDLRYSRLFFNRLHGGPVAMRELRNKIAATLPPTPDCHYHVYGYHEGLGEDYVHVIFADKRQAKEYTALAQQLTGRDITWRVEATYTTVHTEQAVEDLRRLLAEQDMTVTTEGEE